MRHSVQCTLLKSYAIGDESNRKSASKASMDLSIAKHKKEFAKEEIESGIAYRKFIVRMFN